MEDSILDALKMPSVMILSPNLTDAEVAQYLQEYSQLHPEVSLNASVLDILNLNHSAGDSSVKPGGSQTGSVRENEEMFDFITEGVLLTTVSVIGLIGNLMAFHVMIRKSTRDSFSNNLRGLSVFDAGFLLLAILTLGLQRLSSEYKSTIFVEMSFIYFGLLHTFRVGSVCVTVCINIERVFAIVFPLKSVTWKRYLLPVSTTIAILYNLPKYFEFEVKVNSKTNASYIATTSLRRDPIYINLYVFWSKVIFFELIPYFTILICNIMIIVKIRKSSKFRSRFNTTDCVKSTHQDGSSDEFNSSTKSNGARRGRKHLLFSPKGSKLKLDLKAQPSTSPTRGISRKHREEHHLGVILIGLSSLFIACQSFKIFPDLYELIVCSDNDGKNCKMEGFSNVITRLSHLFVCFNSTANFVIYYMNGEKFRSAWLDTYKGVFLCHRQKSWKRSSHDIQPVPTLV